MWREVLSQLLNINTAVSGEAVILHHAARTDFGHLRSGRLVNKAVFLLFHYFGTVSPKWSGTTVIWLQTKEGIWLINLILILFLHVELIDPNMPTKYFRQRGNGHTLQRFILCILSKMILIKWSHIISDQRVCNKPVCISVKMIAVVFTGGEVRTCRACIFDILGEEVKDAHNTQVKY